MGLSFTQYTASGGENQYSIAFPYLEESDITVALDGADEPFTFASSTLVDVTSGNPANGVIVEVRRTTNRATREVDYQNGTNLVEATLDLDSNQLFFVMQEAFDDIDNAIQLNSAGNYDALDVKVDGIGNLPDFTTTYDDFAVNLESMKAYFLASVGAAGAFVISAFWQTILDDENLATSMTSLGLSSAVQSVLDDASLAAMRTTLGVTDASAIVLQSLLTTRGDIVYRNATVAARLAIGTVGQIVGSDGTDPLWKVPVPFAPQGLNCSLDSGTPDEDLNVTAGSVRDATNVHDMVLATEITKGNTGTWAVGDDANGLDTGVIAASTGYYVWLIKRADTGIVDVLISLSATAPTMPTSYDFKRLIGYVATDATSDFIVFTQVGDYFRYTGDIIDDLSDATITDDTFETAALTVPASSLAHIYGRATNTTSTSVNGELIVRTAGAADAVDSNESMAYARDPAAYDEAKALGFVLVDSSSQVNYTASETTGAVSVGIKTLGFLMLTRSQP